MPNTESEPCPLCSTSAVQYPVDYGNRKYFDCPACGRFQVSRLAEKRLITASQQWQGACAAKAKETPEGYLLVISVPSAGQGDSASLVAEHIAKTQLPL